MTPAELRAVAAAALGKGWQRALARALGVSEVTVSRWANGHQPVSAAMAIAIQCVCHHDMVEVAGA